MFLLFGPPSFIFHLLAYQGFNTKLLKIITNALGYSYANTNSCREVELHLLPNAFCLTCFPHWLALRVEELIMSSGTLHIILETRVALAFLE